MIITRAECRLLSKMFIEQAVNATSQELNALMSRIIDEASKPDALPVGWHKDADGIIRPTDDTIRRGDRVWQSNNPGRRAKWMTDLFRPEERIAGTVMQVTLTRARVLFDECDAIPFPDYAQWVDLKELHKGELPK